MDCSPFVEGCYTTCARMWKRNAGRPRIIIFVRSRRQQDRVVSARGFAASSVDLRTIGMLPARRLAIDDKGPAQHTHTLRGRIARTPVPPFGGPAPDHAFQASPDTVLP